MDQPITDFVTSPHRHLGQFPGNFPLRIFQIDAEQLVVRDRHLGLRNIAAGFDIHPVVQRRPLSGARMSTFITLCYWSLRMGTTVEWRTVGCKLLYG
ncbi:hypothetical protein BDV12DRAFT_173599 [Aspergillus spectabilis]